MRFDLAWTAGKEERAAQACLKGGDTAMDKSQNPTDLPNTTDMIAFIKQVVATWKERGRKHFEAHQELNPEVFEQFWPMILENFFLAQTVRVVKVLSLLSKGHDN
jgi:hypothetical protein